MTVEDLVGVAVRFWPASQHEIEPPTVNNASVGTITHAYDPDGRGLPSVYIGGWTAKGVPVVDGDQYVQVDEPTVGGWMPLAVDRIVGVAQGTFTGPSGRSLA